MYNYIEEMAKNIKDIASDYDWDMSLPKDALIEKMCDDLWAEDSVTGNGPFRYGTDAECKEYINGNLDLLKNALQEFGVDANVIVNHFYDENYAYFDTTIRCYLLYEAIEKYLEDLVNKE